jgi:hypothetical protein
MNGLALLLAAVAAGGFNDSLETFPIGFWNYAPIEVFDEAKIQEWQDAGITLTMGPEYRATPENIARMKQILEWADARDIRVIVCDPRTRAITPFPPDFEVGVKAAADDFAGYPAAFGFHVTDEPGTAEFEATCETVQAVKRGAPSFTPFVNLLPWYEDVYARVGYDNWQTYLDDFLKKSGMPFLCYDCYAQMNPDQTGWPMYFRNLREYGEAARRNGVPFWTTILSVGHFHYRCPSEDDIRWQFNSAVAYGAQGILYFFFYMRQPHDNYRLSPVDEFWDRTPVFESLKRTNKGFIKRYGRLFLDLSFQKAMQHPKPVEGCAPFEADDLVAAVRTDGDRPVIVSRFADKQGRPYVAVVCNSTEESTHATLVFRGAGTQAFQPAWNGGEQGAGVKPDPEMPDCVQVTHWLAPGQMEVYRVQQ